MISRRGFLAVSEPDHRGRVVGWHDGPPPTVDFVPDGVTEVVQRVRYLAGYTPALADVVAWMQAGPLVIVLGGGPPPA